MRFPYGGDGNDSIACWSSGILNGGSGDDTFSYVDFASDILLDVVSVTIDGGTGQDYLEVNYGYTKSGITMTWDAITNQGTINNSNSLVNFLNIEKLNINGTSYDDTLLGGNGDDILVGGTPVYDDDSILDDYGNDILIGGNGNDSLTGTGGDDTFVFNNYNEGIDTIFFFNPNNDLIQVSANGFGGGLSPSVLLFSQFAIGTAASQESQRFIYDNNTGALYFDQDGNATGFTQVQFAQLSAGLSLNENNFTVV
ncbi:calcium-binding protein [Tolypothrix sp. FACHB-123]|uniref:calcium-binding protein n=1 Tax=Tolypothrix sp. FACHB-123 TaxID=2692868 RepID=UPI001687925C|nr:calcium-binding protein [Tolypothrix sp. FACHB-123]MBD2359545.1 calcium-binding protein [Tolypothrix sp. FACHB-123]